MAAAIVLACRTMLIAVFTVSVASKVRSPSAWRSFRLWLTAMPLRPLSLAGAPAALAGAEAATVALAAIPATATIGLATGCLVSLCLSGGLLVAVRRGAREPCHCFGASQDPLGYQQVLRNAALFALALAGAALAAAGGGGPGALGSAGRALAAIAGLTAAVLIIFSADVVALLTLEARS